MLVLPLVGLCLEEVEHHRRPHAVAEEDDLFAAVPLESLLDQLRHVGEVLTVLVCEQSVNDEY